MKRLVSCLCSFCLALSLVPAAAFAAADAQDASSQAPATAAGSQPADVQALAVTPAFRTKSFASLHEDGTADFATALPKVALKTSANYSGVKLKGKKDQLAAARVKLGSFDFGEGSPGFIALDALRERGTDKAVDVSFYLDDAAEPLATFALPNVYGKDEWNAAGAQMLDISKAGVTGKHELSLAIQAASEKNTELLLRSFMFMQATGLPTLNFDLDESRGSIDAMNGSSNHSRECYGSVTLSVPEGYRSEYAPDAVAQGGTYELEYIRGRGNSTWGADKKPYKVKLAKKADLLGMGANKHWVLLANRYDNSLLRNKLTYWLGDELGMEYTPQCVFVDVIMNGTYLGSYYLCEQIRVGDSRVAIDDLEDAPEASDAPEVTGGYLLSMDGGGWFDDELAEESGDPRDVSTRRGMQMYVESPEYDDEPTDGQKAQYAYIKDYLQKTEDAIFGTGFADSSGTPYSEYLDVDSAVDYYWMQELSSNGDAYGSGSTYLYKKRDGKLFWGPLWDFDFVAWGDLEYGEYSTQGFTWASGWTHRMMQDPAFAKKMRERWPQIKEKLAKLTREGGQLDQWASQLAVSQYYDHALWGSYGGVWWEDFDFAAVKDILNAGGSLADTLAALKDQRSYSDEIEQLRGWIEQRVQWIDENLDQLEPQTCKVKYYVDGKLKTTQTYLSGEDIVLPKAPTKKGYVFKGWYTAKNGKGDKVNKYWAAVDGLKLYAAWTKASKVKKPTGIYFLSKAAYVYKMEQDFQMPVDVKPAGAKKSSLKWSSSDESVATVSSGGTATFKGTGTTTITARYGSKVKASYKLTVAGRDDNLDWPWDISLGAKSMKLKKGAYKQVKVSQGKGKVQWSEYRFTSLDPKIASVGKAGLVRAKKAGSTYIMVMGEELPSPLFCKVKVTKK